MTSPPLVEPLTVDRLAAHLGITSVTAANVDQLELHLRAAIARVETMCGPVLPREQTFSLVVRRGVALSPVYPLVSLTAMDADGEPVDVELAEGGVVRAAVSGRITATAMVGLDPVPADIALGALIIAGHLYELQRVPGTADRGFGQSNAAPTGFAIPRRAESLLAPYRLVSVR